MRLDGALKISIIVLQKTGAEACVSLHLLVAATYCCSMSCWQNQKSNERIFA